MSIGAGILLFVVGAVLRFAITVELSWISLPLTGNILMIAGAAIVVLGLVFAFRRRRTTRRTVVGPAGGQTTVRRTTDTDDTGL